MPDAEAVAIAKAAVQQIQEAELSQQFTLERSYADWDLELHQVEQLRVDVVGLTTGYKLDAIDRSQELVYTVPLDVAIRKRWGGDEQGDDTGRIPNERIDELMYFTQELASLFTQSRLSEYLQGVWKEEPKILAAPIRKHLARRQFTSIVRLNFQSLS